MTGTAWVAALHRDYHVSLLHVWGHLRRNSEVSLQRLSTGAQAHSSVSRASKHLPSCWHCLHTADLPHRGIYIWIRSHSCHHEVIDDKARARRPPFDGSTLAAKVNTYTYTHLSLAYATDIDTTPGERYFNHEVDTLVLWCITSPSTWVTAERFIILRIVSRIRPSNLVIMQICLFMGKNFETQNLHFY